MKMKLSIYIVLCVVNFVAAVKDTYRAAIVRDRSHSDLNAYIPTIYEAGRKNVDILVLPASETLNSKYNYDESVKNVAKAARQARVYVAAHLQDSRDTARTTLVFNRDGAIISLYRKQVNTANCSASEEMTSFSTDFGTEFTLLMEEDLALLEPTLMKGRNLIVTGSWPAEIPFLTAGQLSGAWSYVSRANVLSSGGIHGGAVTPTGLLGLADVNNNGRDGVLPPPVVSPSSRVPGEDLSQYIIRPLDVQASASGYTETVCHHKFCCQFYVKANFKGSKSPSVNYGLAAFDGVRHFGKKQYIGTQTCALFACAGLYKRSCDLGAQNSTDIFEEISISGNFTKHSAQFPMLVSSDVINSSQYTMEHAKLTTVTIRDASVLSFGIFGRDFAKDREAMVEKEAFADSEGLFNEDVQEFIDYVWIRLRILIFVVSIYILEMM